MSILLLGVLLGMFPHHNYIFSHRYHNICGLEQLLEMNMHRSYKEFYVDTASPLLIELVLGQFLQHFFMHFK